jgi:hypothetical protein
MEDKEKLYNPFLSFRYICFDKNIITFIACLAFKLIVAIVKGVCINDFIW